MTVHIEIDFDHDAEHPVAKLRMLWAGQARMMEWRHRLTVPGRVCETDVYDVRILDGTGVDDRVETVERCGGSPTPERARGDALSRHIERYLGTVAGIMLREDADHDPNEVHR